MKTSSIPYDLEKLDSFVHITNYSVQKYNDNFSKHEIGNEVSFDEFQKELDKISTNEKKIIIEEDIIPKIKEIIIISFRSVSILQLIIKDSRIN